MATKAQLIAYAHAHSVPVSHPMSKATIEQRLRDAGHNPDMVGPIQQSEPAPQAPEPQAEQQEEDVPTQFTEEQAGEKAVAPEDAYEKGWWGARPEVFDDAEFTLETGPNSPSAHHYEDPENYDPNETIVTDEMPAPQDSGGGGGDGADVEQPQQQVPGDQRV